MTSLADQLRAIIERRAVKLPDVARAVASDIDTKMKDNTLNGRGFGADEYDNTYSPRYSVKKGRIAPVTLRADRRRIEQTNVQPQPGGTRISFVDGDGGRIFKYHHDGTARGGKTRSIFPKSVQSVPLDTKQIAIDGVWEVLQP
jgi:hypothetical protein